MIEGSSWGIEQAEQFIAIENVIVLTKTKPGTMICLQGHRGKDRAVYEPF